MSGKTEISAPEKGMTKKYIKKNIDCTEKYIDNQGIKCKNAEVAK